MTGYDIQTHALSLDYCKTCDLNMCNACADDHIQSHCSMKRIKTINEVATNRDLGTGILRDFNYGALMKVDLRDLKCICGKKLGPTAAICAACGMVTNL